MALYRSEFATSKKTEIAVSIEDNVIEQYNTNDFSGGFELLRDLNVPNRRFQGAGRVIM